MTGCQADQFLVSGYDEALRTLDRYRIKHASDDGIASETFVYFLGKIVEDAKPVPDHTIVLAKAGDLVYISAGVLFCYFDRDAIKRRWIGSEREMLM